MRESWKRNHLKNVKKRRVHACVRKALRVGTLSRMPCEVCGEIRVEAHHDDYNKPLEVRWLCIRHHNQWHTENGEGANGR